MQCGVTSLWAVFFRLPMLSASNLGYLILPLCALAAAVAIPSWDDSRFGIGLLIDGILVTASLLVVLVILPLGRAAYLSQTVNVPRILLATAAGVYLGLVAMTFVVVRKAEAGRKLSPTLMMLGWGVIAAAGVVHVFKDHADQVPNDLVVLGWAGGMYFVALSGITSRPGPEPDLGFSRPAPSRASLWLPYLPVLLAIVVGAVHFLAHISGRGVHLLGLCGAVRYHPGPPHAAARPKATSTSRGVRRRPAGPANRVSKSATIR